jgi:predicted transglutaminase-like cysteine proteinase
MFTGSAYLRIFATTLLAAILLTANAQAGSLSLAQLATQATGQARGEFDSTALPSAEPNSMAKWRAVAAASKRDLAAMELCLEQESNCTTEAARELRSFLLQNRESDSLSQLQAVNDYFNTWPYRSDLQAYGKADYWASPLTFLENAGDCEDYAIVKFVALMLLGFDENKMKLVAVFDEARELPHAVLSISFQGETYILDSLRDDVAPDRGFRSYRALYSVNFNKGWIHLPRNDGSERAFANRLSD